jgi:hypothetical protein
MDDLTFETEKAKRAARDWLDAIAEWEEDPGADDHEKKMIALGLAMMLALQCWREVATPVVESWSRDG